MPRNALKRELRSALDNHDDLSATEQARLLRQLAGEVDEEPTANASGVTVSTEEAGRQIDPED